MVESVLNHRNQFQLTFSADLIGALSRVADKSTQKMYVVGGTVRDHLLGRNSQDLDVAVSGSALLLAKQFIRELKGGALIDLSTPDDEACRVVYHGEQVDFASFRSGSQTILQDLRLRDFTINAIAIPLKTVLRGEPLVFLDPTGGVDDLKSGRVVHCEGAFAADPVRMVRGFRLCATLGFELADGSVAEIDKHAERIVDVAVERILVELVKIFESSATTKVLRSMAEVRLLPYIFPELYLGQGVDQPYFHHLDVFEHCFLALQKMEEIILHPEYFFFTHEERIARYLESEKRRGALKWAALFHDVGKPETMGYESAENGRITFYRHDEAGKNLFKQVGQRLKLSKRDVELIADFIGMHMHPFHLCNNQREDCLTKRAVLKLCRRAGDNLIGLFLLAMSDSLASEGTKKPKSMETELNSLFAQVLEMYDELIEPVLIGPRLITGRDLIETFSLAPGPQFSEIMTGLEVARIEGDVSDRPSALRWVADFLAEKE